MLCFQFPMNQKIFEEFFFKHWHQVFWKGHAVLVSCTFWPIIMLFPVSLLVLLVATKMFGIWESSVAENPAASRGLAHTAGLSLLEPRFTSQRELVAAAWSAQLWSLGNTCPRSGAAAGVGVICRTLKLRSRCRPWMCWQSYEVSSESTPGFIAVTIHNFLIPELKPWMLAAGPGLPNLSIRNKSLINTGAWLIQQKTSPNFVTHWLSAYLHTANVATNKIPVSVVNLFCSLLHMLWEYLVIQSIKEKC